MRSRTKKILICTFLFLVIIFIYNDLNFSQTNLIYKNLELRERYYSLFKSNFRFDINKNVLVFVHIQKTGGSDFDRNIVRHLLISKEKYNWNRACEFVLNRTEITINKNIKFVDEDEDNKLRKKLINKKKIKFKKFACKRNEVMKNGEPNWYFSRQTFGWICGLHPYYTELRDCVSKFYPDVMKSDFFYFTILRDPVKRYISEWQHVRRGATWKRSTNQQCIRQNEYEKCYEGHKNWENATLEQFVSCKYNQANNRQTRMLAFYDSQCNQEPDSVDLLNRAKKTLNSMIYFAINEYQYFSQILFEKSLGENLFKFEINLKQYNKTIADLFFNDLIENKKDLIEKIKNVNSLDIQLYNYGKELFFERLKKYNIL